MTKEEGDNSFGVASLVLGIMGIVVLILMPLAFLAPFAGLTLSIISLVFALVQRKKNKNSWVKASLIISIIGIVLNGLASIWLISFIIGMSNQYQALCDAAGGCENVASYLQSQQLQQASSSLYGA